MASARDYGSPPDPKPPKHHLSDRTVETVTGYWLSAIVAIVVVLGILTPFVYYVVNIVPAQHEQRQELMLQCMAHHPVKTCDDIMKGPVAKK